MLNQDALQQLKQLKQNIREQTDRGEGIVRGSQGRYGFVRLDDGRDVFLPPDTMQRVFPGDRVAVIVHTGSDGKTTAELEKLLDSPLSTFTGKYVVRGQGHFVEVDLPRFNRLVFLPPSERKGRKEGDFLACRIQRHPFRDGKSQAKVLKLIGSPDKPGVEAEYCIAKFQLAEEWSQALLQTPVSDRCREQREDLTDIAFLTIDSPDTRDMDDALYAEPGDDGWRLLVAVADPTAFIAPGSALEQAARRRGSTVYMPGRVLPMLPESITNDSCSLQPDQERAAIVCEIQVGSDGSVRDYRFRQALIRSRAKLSYSDVFAWLRGENPLPQPGLDALRDVAAALLEARRRKHVVMLDRPDFRIVLNERRKIEAIVRVNRNDAHRLVEECMVAANRCAADFLRADTALFYAHSGIRSERLEGIKTLLTAELPEAADIDAGSLDGYVELIRRLSAAQSPVPLHSIVTRMLERGQLSTSARPHHGLGFECYTTFTSPLRKFTDFLVHRCLRAKLQGEAIPAPTTEDIEALQQSLDSGRQAGYQMEQWLKCQYLDSRRDQTFAAHILHVSGGGFTVRLDDSGIEGFVDVRSIEGKLSFDANYLRLSNGERCFQLEQAVTVKVASIDQTARSISFELAG